MNRAFSLASHELIVQSIAIYKKGFNTISFTCVTTQHYPDILESGEYMKNWDVTLTSQPWRMKFMKK